MKTVKEIVKKKVILISEDDDISKAFDLFQKHNIRHLPVMNGLKLVGILTDRDVRLAITSIKDPKRSGRFHYYFKDIKVGEIMTPYPVTVEPDTDIKKVTNLFIRNKIGCAPVVSGDRRLEGIVTETDLLKAMAKML